jgi:hypothetical protein
MRGMARPLAHWLVLATGLSLSGCSLTLTMFVVPPQVWTGQEFEVVVQANTNNTTSGDAACILQLPIGFTVEGSVSVHANVQPQHNFIATRDEPALLQPYAAEPGHYLAGFSGRDQVMATFKVIARAPASPSGQQSIKIALAGNSGPGTPYQATDPPGITAFAAITGAAYVRPIRVLGDPPMPFALDTNGLLGPGTLGVRWWGAALGDVDGDGNADLALSSGDPVFGPVRDTPHVWLSRPGSAWVERSQGFTFGRIVDHTFRPAFGDFDRDGFLDLAVSRGDAFFGNGGASWTPVPVIPGFWQPADGVAVGDIDHDGIDDVAFGGDWNPIRVFRSNGDRTFAERSNGLVTAGPGGFGPMLLQDVTGDGLCDLVAADGPTNGTSYPQAAAWAGDGQGNWTRTTGLPPFSDVAAGDVDGDGRVDLVLALSAGGTAIYSFQGGAWSPSTTTPPAVPYSSASIALLDHDRDGWLDIAVAPNRNASGPMQLWHSQGGARYVLVQDSGLSSWCTANCYSLVAGDIDGDTFPDLVAACLFEQPMVWHNTNAGLSPYGSPCSGGGHAAPRLRTTGTLRRGSTDFTYVMSGPPNGYAVLWLGTSMRFAFGLPILPRELDDFGAPGCSLLAAPDVEFFLRADAAGQSALTVRIPNDPDLARRTMFVQGAVVAPGGNALGWLFTAGLATRIP